ncbi:MFS transporter [Pararobbsia silviterrae]|nr:MFS transporter [Pararobbsia silviterrae]
MSTVIAATSFISCLELFDFTVFALFAGTIGEQFFPSSNPMTSLLLAVGTFGVGFLMRPLGAIWIGRHADRRGRRAALVVTSMLMALSTAAIALCPAYAAIGVAAPIVVVIARLLAGLAAGGEVGAAATYAMDTVPVARRGFAIGWQLAGQGAAALLGACTGLALTHALTPASFASWGWRMPFALGALVAPAGLYVRLRLPETRTHAPRDDEAADRALIRPVALATLMMLWRTIPFYAIVVYMPSYLTRVMHFPERVGFRCAALSALVLVIVAPLSGRLADRLTRRKPLLLATSGLTTLLVYPVFFVIVHARGEGAVLAAVAAISALIGLGASIATVLVLEGMPARARATGFAVSYALGVGIFGGTAQFAATALVRWTGDPMSVAWYVAPACLVSFIACGLFDERRVRA